MPIIGNTVAEPPYHVRLGRASVPSPDVQQAAAAWSMQQQEQQADLSAAPRTAARKPG